MVFRIRTKQRITLLILVFLLSWSFTMFVPQEAEANPGGSVSLKYGTLYAANDLLVVTTSIYNATVYLGGGFGRILKVYILNQTSYSIGDLFATLKWYNLTGDSFVSYSQTNTPEANGTLDILVNTTEYVTLNVTVIPFDSSGNGFPNGTINLLYNFTDTYFTVKITWIYTANTTIISEQYQSGAMPNVKLIYFWHRTTELKEKYYSETSEAELFTSVFSTNKIFLGNNSNLGLGITALNVWSVGRGYGAEKIIWNAWSSYWIGTSETMYMRRMSGDQISIYLKFEFTDKFSFFDRAFVERFPWMHTGAFSIVDDDAKNVSTWKAILYGCNDTNDPYVKTVFGMINIRFACGYWSELGGPVHGFPYYVWINDTTDTIATETRNLYLWLWSMGYEMNYHTTSSIEDNRTKTLKGFEIYKNLFGEYPKLYVDHGPTSENPEHITAQGSNVSSPYYLIDILDKYSKYLWPGFITHRGAVNLFNYSESGKNFPFFVCDNYRPILYEVNGTVVRAWFFIRNDFPNADPIVQYLTYEAIDKLEEEYGLNIMYTHMHNWLYASGGKIYLNKTVADRIRYVTTKNIWIDLPTVVMDYLVARQQITATFDGSTLTIKNDNNFNVQGVTVRIYIGDQHITDISGSLFFKELGNGWADICVLNVPANGQTQVKITLGTATYRYPRIQQVGSQTEINALSFTDQRLHVVLEGPTGVTGTTVIYCPYDPIVIFEDGELKTSDYTWNPDTKLLTVNVTFSSPVELDVYFAVPRVESHKVEGEFLGYVFPGTQTVKLNLQLYSEGSQVSQDTRIILEVYNMDGALIYTTAKRETLTQETKTVAFNIPDLEPGIYLVKITLQNPDTGETLNTYSFLLKVTYPWWLWLTAIIAAIGIATVIMYKKKRKTFSLKERLQHVA